MSQIGKLPVVSIGRIHRVGKYAFAELSLRALGLGPQAVDDVRVRCVFDQARHLHAESIGEVRTIAGFRVLQRVVQCDESNFGVYKILTCLKRGDDSTGRNAS